MGVGEAAPRSDLVVHGCGVVLCGPAGVASNVEACVILKVVVLEMLMSRQFVLETRPMQLTQTPGPGPSAWRLNI